MSQGFQQVLMVKNINAKVTFEIIMGKAWFPLIGIIWNVNCTVNKIFISHVTFQRGLVKIFRYS